MFPPSRNSRENNDPIPHCPFGLLFVREILWPPQVSVPRICSVHVMSQAMFNYHLRQSHTRFMDIHAPIAIPSHQVSTCNYIPTRKALTKPSWSTVQPISTFQHLTIDLLPLLNYMSNQLDDLNDLEQLIYIQASKRIDSIWAQFVLDVMQKCENSHGLLQEDSHCCLTMADQEHLSTNTFINMNLALVFWWVQ